MLRWQFFENQPLQNFWTPVRQIPHDDHWMWHNDVWGHHGTTSLLRPARARSPDCPAMRTTGAARVIDVSTPAKGGGRGEATGRTEQNEQVPALVDHHGGRRAAEPGMTTCCLCSDENLRQAGPRFVRSNGAQTHSRTPQGCVWNATGPMGLLRRMLQKSRRRTANMASMSSIMPTSSSDQPAAAWPTNPHMLPQSQVVA
jgi:hypothetical protein